MTRRLPFTKTATTRAVRGVRAAGLEVARVEIDPDGRIIVIPGKPGEPRASEPASNSLDEWLSKRSEENDARSP